MNGPYYSLRVLVFLTIRPIAIQCFALRHSSKQNIVGPKDHKRSKLEYCTNSWPYYIFKNISIEKIRRKIFHHCNFLKSFNCYYERTLPLYSSWTCTLSILAKNLAITWADFLQEFSNPTNGPRDNIQNCKRRWQIILKVFYHDYWLIILPIQRSPSFKHLNCNLKWIWKI